MIERQSVSNTLYVPLAGNVYTSRNFKELLYDEKALELEKSMLKDDIQVLNEEYYYLASSSRYYNMDLEIQSFIKEHGFCNIVNIGAGLDTSYYRTGSSEATFYEIDLPAVIEERSRLMAEQENDVYIACSFLNVDEWVKLIKNRELPTLLIFSGVFYYFREEVINQFFREIKNKFSFCEAVFDCNSRIALRISNRYVRKTGNKSAPMYFYVDNINSYLKKLNLNITSIKEYMMFKYSRKILKRASIGTKIKMCVSDMFRMVKIEHIRIN
ncbi:conjugal transfer protein [Candidatus Fermentibacteria bacterium]|nr:MAG: conjugal transfer protein [Candidatus Fermentibacteria bacterium]